MQTSTKYILGGLGLVAFIVAINRKVKAILSLDFTAQSPKNVRVIGLDVFFVLPILVYNSEKASLTFTGTDGTLYANSQAIGNGYAKGKQVISPQGNSMIYIDCQTSFLNLFTAIGITREALKGQSVDFTYVGLVSGEGFESPVQVSKSFALPKLF